MAHQCLKCGKTYPDGSPQILRGCEGCKGTRFFYTDAPLGATERQELAERAELDLERLAMGKGVEGPARSIPTKQELPFGAGRDWVDLGPNYLRNVVEDVVKRAHERKPVFRVGQAPPQAQPPTLAQWVRENAPVDDAADAADATTSGRSTDLLDGLVDPARERAWRAAAHGEPAEPPTPDPPAQDEVVYKRVVRRAPRPVSLAGIEMDAPADDEVRARAQAALEEAKRRSPEILSDNVQGTGEDASIYPEGQAPETVAVKAAGVYELDVKRLLEKQPIVVHRDGTYSLHLPSLMETLKRRG